MSPRATLSASGPTCGVPLRHGRQPPSMPFSNAAWRTGVMHQEAGRTAWQAGSAFDAAAERRKSLRLEQSGPCCGVASHAGLKIRTDRRKPAAETVPKKAEAGLPRERELARSPQQSRHRKMHRTLAHDNADLEL